MRRDDEAYAEDVLAESLADYQDRLATGKSPVIDPVLIPEELRSRFERDRAFLDYLEDAWPCDRGPRSAGGSPCAPDEWPDPSSREPPARIGRFELLEELGHGGHGVVFLAFDPMLNRRVALKVPAPGTLVSPALRQRFFREARLAAALDHPNVVTVHEVDQAGPIIYIASTYCERGPLSSWIAQEQRGIPPRLAARIVADLSDAVQHAHDRGILHRDLKPSNVLLREPPTHRLESSDYPFTPCIGDFGLSKIIGADLKDSLSGEPIGTPQYMSPEQAGGRHREIGPATDVYGLGAILYELLTGVPPFQGTTRAETIQKVIGEEPRPPRHVRRGVPRELESICLACLQKRPVRRYPGPGELAHDLNRFLAGRSISPPMADRGERALRWLRQRAWSAAAVVVLFLFVPSLYFLSAMVRQYRADDLLKRLMSTDLERVPGLSTELAPAGEELGERLRQWAREAGQSERGTRAALVLLPREESHVVELCQRILVSQPRELSVIRTALLRHQGAAARKYADRFWELLQNDRLNPSKALSAACALAAIDSKDFRWRQYGPTVADSPTRTRS